ncbi:MAG: HupE/UreJ family protein [Rhodospirillaceae bacterium]|nr:HupE/UreJ family protein [Rhodospirillaceae bacterium]MCK5545782.1 HupE/UreJ family protein [Rhodospirillaceae bacterium]
MKRLFFVIAAILALVSSPVLAHTGAGSVSDISAGFGHPIGGIDHVLAMLAVGILAAQLGGKSLWFVPAAFVGMMVVGGLLGISGVPVPFVELGIVGSIIVLGGAIAAGRKIPMSLAMSMVGLVAIFHGHAHGTEMPANISAIEYSIGFIAATSLLHAFGISLIIGARKVAKETASIAIRVSGGSIAVTGAALLTF